MEIFENNLVGILKETRKVPELGMSEHAFSALKKEVLAKLK
mgnify:CR=1 FL=1